MRLHASSPTTFTGPPTTGTSPFCKRLNRSLHLRRVFGLNRLFLLFFDQNFATLEWDIGRSKFVGEEAKKR